MLQRSPTYFLTGRNANELADTLRELQIHERLDPRDRPPQDPATSRAVFTQRCFDEPELVEDGAARRTCAAILGPDYDIDTHFTPRYRPWQQRIAFVPDGDLFEGIAERQGLGRHRRDRDASPRPASC